jgi:WD40 repeat protein/serine/threonine protein kinase
MPTTDREEAVFAAVLEKSTRAERSAYLDGACGDDHTLRARIEALLAAHEASGGVLDAPPSAVTPTAAYRPLTEGPGTKIGSYKLLQQIGEGGMGVVYMAEQTEPVRRMVALKIIKPGMDSAQVIARFEAERQALAMMDHPNIARVLDAGTTESGRPYFVMELVHGVPITQFCDDSKLSPRERLALFVPVCQAIQHAHQKGIIHRDVKPSNVLVTMYDDKPVPKVIDFGVAKAIEQRLTEKSLFTQFGALVGTFEYMSPEQVEMNALGVDTRSDVYSLGVLLYELLTGTTPIERKRLRTAALDELVRLIKEEEPPRPSVKLSSSDNLPKIAAARKTEPERLSKLVRGDIDWIVMKCLEKDRSRRYDTVSGLARDVERHLADEPVEACPPSAVYRARKFLRKHRRGVLTTVAVMLVCVLAGVGQTLHALRQRQAEALAIAERERAAEAEQTAAAKQHEAERARQQLEQTLYASRIQLAQRAWQENHISHARELLETHWDAAGKEPFTFKAHVQSGNTMTVSPDGRRIASSGDGGKVKLWDSATGKELLSLDHPRQVDDVAFSPDGRRLASACWDRMVRLWDSATGKELLSFKAHDDVVMSVAFSPDGQRLASGGRDKLVKVWDSATGKEVLSLAGHTDDVRSVAFSPDGQRLASASWDKTVKLWDNATGKKVLSLKGHTGGVYAVAFSPDGTRLASGSQDGTVKLWDSATGKELLSLAGHAGEVSAVAFTPAGTRLVSMDQDGSIRLWETNVSPQVLDRRAAKQLVADLFRQKRRRADVLEWLRTVPGMSPYRRQQAIEIAQTYPEEPR